MTAGVWQGGHVGDQALRRALALSISLHALLLLWQPVHRPSRETGAPVLSVNFAPLPQATEMDSAEAALAVGMPEAESPEALTAAAPDLATLVPRRQEQETPQQISTELTPVNAGAPADSSISAVADDSKAAIAGRTDRRRGQASMVIEVSDDGRIRQIIWGKLPSMDTATLDRLEAAIRARGYAGAAADRFMRLNIDIRDYLEPERDDSAGVGAIAE